MGKIRRKRKISFKYLILAVVGLLLIYFFFFSSPPELDYRVLINCIREGKFEEMKISKIVDLVISTNLTTVIITGSIVLSSGRIVPFRTEVPNSIFSFDFVKSGVLKNPIISGGISIVDVSKPSFLSALLTQILVLLIFFGLAYFLM